MKTDIYGCITAQIIKQLEQGVRPWMLPWSGSHAAGSITRPLRCNGEPYNGINILMLWGRAMECGYAAPIWMTFKQAQEFGGHVKKGEKGSMVVYASSITRSETNDQGDDEARSIPFLKAYTVFNIEQMEGLPAKFAPSTPLPLPLPPKVRNQRAESFFARTGADIRFGGGRAFYAANADYIQMPNFNDFRDAESFYGTLAHECTHWTMHESRLARDLGGKRFGDEGYAMEELVAELGAAFLCADLGLEPEVREDHAGYIENWLAVLKNDKRAIFTAASKASEATTWLLAKAGQGAA